MSVKKVKTYFAQFGIADRVREFETSSATVELAAEALNCAPERIAKSLSFKLKNQNKYVLVVTAGDTKVDNAKFKAQFGEKASMLSADETETAIGYAVGGVCPFAVNEGVEIFLDVSLKRFNTVFPACGSSNSVIELTISELERYSNYSCWVDVSKSKTGNIE